MAIWLTVYCDRIPKDKHRHMNHAILISDTYATGLLTSLWIHLLIIDTCISKHLVYLCCKCIISSIYTRHLLHVCPSWERDPSSVALPEVSPMFPFKLWGFSLEVFPCTMWGSKDRGCHIVILIFCTNCGVHWDKCNICDIGPKTLIDNNTIIKCNNVL